MNSPDPPLPRAGVEDRSVAGADEFLNVLSPRAVGWRNEASSWIFRGQGSAEWELRPSAVRDAAVFERFGITLSFHAPPPEWGRRAALQDELLKVFRRGLDRSGLVVPSPSPKVDYREQAETSRAGEPFRQAFPLMAFAQHHGLPTLLLDWTRRAWVAAYFAAVQALDTKSTAAATHLAVYALHLPSTREVTEAALVYEAPGGTNPNLAAQSGLFTFFVDEDDPSLEQYLLRESQQRGLETHLVRFTLRTAEAPLLLQLLSQEGIDGAALFPGADGVVRAMRERVLWGSPQPPKD